MARPALRRASINARSVCAAKFLLVIIHSGCVCLAVFVFFGAARKTRLNEISIYFELLFFCLFLCGWRGVEGDGGCKRFIRAGDKWFWKCSDAPKHKLTLTF